jgi:hypothetical protein
MYVLQYLKQSQQSRSGSDEETVEVEYRLACSGELYNRRVITADWRKSDITRVLLREPFELFVVGHPFDEYPQELCVRLKLSYVTEKKDWRGILSTSTFLPDEEVVQDLSSILSLLARRLISVAGKISERSPKHIDALGSYGRDCPISILRHSEYAAWGRRPISINTSVEGQQVEFNILPPTGVDDRALKEVLLKLPGLPIADEVIHACRLYKSALELIESRPDITIPASDFSGRDDGWSSSTKLHAR